MNPNEPGNGSVKSGPALDNLTAALVDICRAGLQADRLREEVLSRLGRAVPFDAAFWATLDPATLLFTRGHQQDIPSDTSAYFVRNEFADDDVNRWTALAQDRAGVRSLAQVTAGDMERSPRFREIFRPLGLGDELRAVFRVGSVCWGCMCLHRQLGSTFTKDERDYVRKLSPHIAEAIRTSLLITSFELPQIADAPGLVVLGADGSIVSSTTAGERWLEELGWPRTETTQAPAELRVLAAVVDRPEDGGHELPRMQMRTLAGRWVVLHGSKLPIEHAPAIAVIIEEATPADLAPILMMAYGLTNRERTITSLVCRGQSTRDIAEQLHITPHTIQDHLKSIFDKTGVRTRRELAMSLLQRDYVPRTMAGTPIGPSGFFIE
jgi:DNA-binding CsgD family transcriptional regulator